MVHLKDSDYSKFQKLVYDKIGISLSEKKKSLVMTRLSKRITFYDFSSYLEYYNLILQDKDELQIMINLITTNETSFFREKSHFEFLKNLTQTHRSEPFRV